MDAKGTLNDLTAVALIGPLVQAEDELAEGEGPVRN
jgi:hypothetical protein